MQGIFTKIESYAYEAAWTSGWIAGFEIGRSQVQIPFWPPADVVLGSPEFNFSSTLVNSQLVCLTPVGILNLVMFIYHYLFILVLKNPSGEWHLHIYTVKSQLVSSIYKGCNFLKKSILLNGRLHRNELGCTEDFRRRSVVGVADLYPLIWNCRQ